ncbi:hypothetical protein ACFIQF_11600 [Comamonas sp. J-3]
MAQYSLLCSRHVELHEQAPSMLAAVEKSGVFDVRWLKNMELFRIAE